MVILFEGSISISINPENPREFMVHFAVSERSALPSDGIIPFLLGCINYICDPDVTTESAVFAAAMLARGRTNIAYEHSEATNDNSNKLN